MTAVLYAHISKESCYEVGHKLGLRGEVLRLFTYAGTEFKLTMDVDEATGRAVVTHVDDRLVDPRS